MEVESTLEHFLKQRNERKETGLEAALYPIVVDLAGDKNVIYLREIWNKIIDGSIIAGNYDDHKPDEYKTEDYGTIYRNQLGSILEHTFGGKRQHRRDGNTFSFDLTKLERVGESFNLKNRIETRLVARHGEDVKAVKTLGIGYEDGNDNIEVSRRKNGLNKEEKQSKLPIPPSQPSRLHTTPDFESVGEELKRIYD